MVRKSSLVAVTLIIMLLSASNNIFFNSVAQVQGTELYPAPVPIWLTVAIEQTPYTVLVVIVANFNESGVSMKIRNDTVWWDGGYTYAIDIVCSRENPGSPIPGDDYVGVWTTLGAPPPGNYTLYVLETAIDPYFIPYNGMNVSHLILKEKTFTVTPVGLLFSNDGIVVTLKTYLNYAEAETMPPDLYAYSRFWINSTSPVLTPWVWQIGVCINNTSIRTLEDVSLTFIPPPSVNLNLTPSNGSYGTLNPGTSNIRFFNVTTEEVPLGIYNLTYVMTYTDVYGAHSVNDSVPIGVCSIIPMWVDSNQTAIVQFTTPYNDNGTATLYNYVDLTTVDGYHLYMYQNCDVSIALSNFTGFVEEIDIAWWIISVLAAIIDLGVTALIEVIKGEDPTEACKLYRNIISSVIAGIAWDIPAAELHSLAFKERLYDYISHLLFKLGLDLAVVNAHALIAELQKVNGEGSYKDGPTIPIAGKGDSKPATVQGSNVKLKYSISELHARQRCDGKTRVWGKTKPWLKNEPIYLYNHRTGKIGFFYDYTNDRGEFDLSTDKDFAKDCDELVVIVGKDFPYMAVGSVHVEKPMCTPKAKCSATPEKPLASQMVTLNASASEPGFDGVNVCPIAWYYWDFGDGYASVNITTPITTHTYITTGDYVVTLTVYAPPGPEASAEYYSYNTTWLMLKVVGLPYSPVANFTEYPGKPYVGQPVYFDASTSQPGFDGDDECLITEYRWDFGDGTSGTGKTVRHVYDKPGEYVVTLTVYAPGMPPYIDPQYVGTNTTDTIQHVKQVIPVGGYSIPINTHITTTPPTTYFAILAIIVAVFTVIRRKTHRKAR